MAGDFRTRYIAKNYIYLDNSIVCQYNHPSDKNNLTYTESKLYKNNPMNCFPGEQSWYCTFVWHTLISPVQKTPEQMPRIRLSMISSMKTHHFGNLLFNVRFYWFVKIMDWCRMKDKQFSQSIIIRFSNTYMRHYERMNYMSKCLTSVSRHRCLNKSIYSTTRS